MKAFVVVGSVGLLITVIFVDMDVFAKAPITKPLDSSNFTTGGQPETTPTQTPGDPTTMFKSPPKCNMPNPPPPESPTAPPNMQPSKLCPSPPAGGQQITDPKCRPCPNSNKPPDHQCNETPNSKGLYDLTCDDPSEVCVNATDPNNPATLDPRGNQSFFCCPKADPDVSKLKCGDGPNATPNLGKCTMTPSGFDIKTGAVKEMTYTCPSGVQQSPETPSPGTPNPAGTNNCRTVFDQKDLLPGGTCRPFVNDTQGVPLEVCCPASTPCPPEIPNCNCQGQQC